VSAIEHGEWLVRDGITRLHISLSTPEYSRQVVSIVFALPLSAFATCSFCGETEIANLSFLRLSADSSHGHPGGICTQADAARCSPEVSHTYMRTH
jgi:hypothetical protein